MVLFGGAEALSRAEGPFLPRPRPRLGLVRRAGLCFNGFAQLGLGKAQSDAQAPEQHPGGWWEWRGGRWADTETRGGNKDTQGQRGNGGCTLKDGLTGLKAGSSWSGPGPVC